VDCQSWLGVHVYLVDGWKHNPILPTLEQLINGGAIDNFKKVIVDNVLQYGGLLESDLVSKLISFGANGILVFHGVKNVVTTQLKEKFAHYMLGVHCVAHQTNLTIQTLSKLPLMFKIEAMLQSTTTTILYLLSDIWIDASLEILWSKRL